MSRFHRLTLIGLIALSCAANLSPLSAADRRSNIVYIMADDK